MVKERKNCIHDKRLGISLCSLHCIFTAKRMEVKPVMRRMLPSRDLVTGHSLLETQLLRLSLSKLFPIQQVHLYFQLQIASLARPTVC